MSRAIYQIPFLLFAFSLFMLFPSFGQEHKIKQYLSAGSELRGKGRLTEAIAQYNEALLLNTNHDEANYLMAATYYDMAKYNECVIHCNKAIRLNSAYDQEAYLLKGKALIKIGKPKDATHVYYKMAVEYPDNFLAYHWLGYAYYKMDDYDNAEAALSTALKMNPNDAESHLVMGNMMAKKGERLKSALALVNYLLLEPRGEKSLAVFNSLQQQLAKGLDAKEANIISISMAADANMDEFTSTDVMNFLYEGKASELSHDQIVKNTGSLFSKLSSMKKESTFWWEFYVHFYNDMNYDKHIETLSHFISQSQRSEETQQWITENQHKVSQLIDWVNGYER
jgi:Flp pilus assembly protein TadD/ribosomal protein S18